MSSTSRSARKKTSRSARNRTLRDLDDSLVPRLAGRLQRGVQRIIRAVREPGWVRDVTAAFRAEPAVAGGIAAVLVAGVLLAMAGDRIDTSGRGTPDSGVALPPASPIGSIGPLPDTSVPDYLLRAAADLRRYRDTANGRATYAVVDLRHYVNPAVARRALTGAHVVRAYVRLPSKKLATPVRAVPLTSLQQLEKGIETAGTVAAATAKSYAQLLSALHPKQKSDREVRKRYAQQHHAAVVEARRLKHPKTCGCVFAFVVRDGPRVLTTLSKRRGVRVVDPAPLRIPISGLTVFPLQPEVTRLVPRPGLPSG